MSLLNFQPENLMSVNFLLGSKIGPWPATLACGLLFVAALSAGIYWGRRRFPLPAILLSAALIGWLPLLVHFGATLLRESAESWDVLFLPAEEQIVWRNCRIDRNQQLGGGFCNLYPFLQEARKRLPAGSRVSLADSALGPYLAYYLYPQYRTSYAAGGDYLILYHPSRPYHFDGRQLFDEESGRLHLIGRYESLVRFSPQEVILKRLP